MIQRFGTVFLFLFFGGWAIVPVHAASPESLGQQAEKARKYSQALKHYTAAIQKTAEKSTAEAKLLSRIVRIVPKVRRKPPVPNAVADHEGRAEAAVQHAKSPKDFLDAASAYHKAIRLAPWVASYYFNLGIVLEKAKKPAGAINSFRWYLLAAPNAPDAQGVRKKIAGIKYLMGKENRRQAERLNAERRQREAKLRRERERRERRQRIGGVWRDSLRSEYRIGLSSSRFEIYRTSFCYRLNCNKRRYINKKVAYGHIQNGRIRGFYIQDSGTRSEYRGRRCYAPPGNHPFTSVNLSANGRKLSIKTKVNDGPGCPGHTWLLDLIR